MMHSGDLYEWAINIAKETNGMVYGISSNANQQKETSRAPNKTPIHDINDGTVLYRSSITRI